MSSDPVLSFLFDEVVIKDWCKRTVKNIISNLQEKCILKLLKLSKLQALSLYLPLVC